MCANVTCEYYGVCMDDNQGYCKCPKSCDQMLQDSKFKISEKAKELIMDYEMDKTRIAKQFKTKKVCATDGTNYESECKMRIAACSQQKNIDVVKIGDCGKPKHYFNYKLYHIFRFA